MTLAERLFQAAKELPEPLAREALDFVLFLQTRADEARWRDLMNAQQTALRDVWDNPEDQVWDNA